MGFLERRAISNLTEQFYRPAFVHTCERATLKVLEEKSKARLAQTDPDARPVLKLRDGLMYDQAIHAARYNAQTVVYRYAMHDARDALWHRGARDLLVVAGERWGVDVDVLLSTRDEAMRLAALEAGDDPETIPSLMPDPAATVKLDTSALAPTKMMQSRLMNTLSTSSN